MKKIILLLLVVASVPALAADSLGTKLADKFSAAFPQAKNVKWYTEGENTAVYYENEGITSHIWYDAQGEVLKTRRYYSEKDLTPFMKVKVNQRYPGKEIHGITEISNRDGLFYVITLEDQKNWIQARFESTGESSLIQKMKKS
ncbi:MAG: hypothetical protein EOO05_06780 [Chitinophagaceae bacterium]|nr:MAG: hypothetical protein EOO05_06780 [Chitinophagaceae bacterium]